VSGTVPVGDADSSLLAAGVAHRVPGIGRESTLRQVSERLARELSGAPLVYDPGEPIDVVSLRDITAAIASGADPDQVKVGDIDLIQRPYITAAAEVDDIAEALVRVAADEALVLDRDGVVGLLCLRDLCHVMALRGESPS
jgi:predicted transcriptional regulator